MDNNLLEYKTINEGIVKLEQHVVLRNQMLGSLNWQIVNDECTALANKLMGQGVDIGLVTDIMKNTKTTDSDYDIDDESCDDPLYDPNEQDGANCLSGGTGQWAHD